MPSAKVGPGTSRLPAPSVALTRHALSLCAQELDTTLPIVQPQWSPVPESGMRVTWIGHASVRLPLLLLLLLLRALPCV